MSTEEAIIAVVRVVGSLLVLRWAFVGGVIAVLVDLSDLFMMNLLDLGGVSSYQAFDKWLDQVYMACFLIVALRWPEPARKVAVALYGVRMVGFAAFELTQSRAVLVAFPNLFEFWFLFVAYLQPQKGAQPAAVRASTGRAAAAAAHAAPPSTATGRRRLFGRRFDFTRLNVTLALLILLAAKEAQEVAIHWLKVFDSFTAVEAVESAWRWLTSPF